MFKWTRWEDKEPHLSRLEQGIETTIYRQGNLIILTQTDEFQTLPVSVNREEARNIGELLIKFAETGEFHQ